MQKETTFGRSRRSAAFDAAATWIIGLTFLLAGIPHWGNSYFFLGSVYAYQLVGPGFGQMVAISLPLIQLTIAVCLLTRVFLDAAHLAAMLCLFCFAGVQSIAFIRGLDISCGCFGPDHDTKIGIYTLSVVYSLLLLSVMRNGVRFRFDHDPALPRFR